MSCLSENEVVRLAQRDQEVTNRRDLLDHALHCTDCCALLAEAARTQDRVDALARTAPAVGGELDPGTRIGRYVLLECAGKGGMGVVYAAHDPELRRRIALKVVPETRQLLHEARAAARLTHPNVVRIYDVGLVEGSLFLAMEYVEGTTLRGWLAQEARSWPRILDAFLAAGAGLAGAHRAGLVHRDFKPDNVLMSRDGRVLVADFGLAQTVKTITTEAGGGGDALQHHGVAGTPAYMSPEQWRGGKLGPESDQYSFCVALHEALLGWRPGELGSGSRPAVARVPGWVKAALARGLSPDPAQRFEHMHQLLRALAWRSRTRRRWRVMSAVAAIAIVATAVAGYIDRGAEASVPACADVGAELAGSWDAARRAEIERAFAATGAPFARDAFRSVAARLDEFAEAWTDGRRATCEAVIAGDDRPAVGARMSCLSRRREALRTLSDLYAEPDAKVIQNSVLAAIELADDPACERLGAGEQSTQDPDTAAFRSKLSRARVLYDTGRYPEALSLTDQVAARFGPGEGGAIAAEARYLIGALRKDDDPQLSATSFELAVTLALAAGADELAARAAIELILVRGQRLLQFDQATHAVSLAQALIERVGDPAQLRARWYVSLGDLEEARSGDYAKVERLYRQALDTWRHVSTADHPFVVDTLRAQAGPLIRLGRFGEAEELANQALAMSRRLVGDEHPDTARVFQVLGVMNLYRKTYPAAEQAFLRVLAIRERTNGTRDRQFGFALNNLAMVYVETGRAALAAPLIERALPIYGATNTDIAGVLHTRGMMHEALGKHRQAIDSYRAGLRASERLNKSPNPRRAVYLKDIGRNYLRVGDRRRARGALERAIAMFDQVPGLPSDMAEARELAAAAAR